MANAAAVVWNRQRIAFDGGIALADGSLRRPRVIVRREAVKRPSVGIDAYVVPQSASKQFVYRHPQRLALNVPQRLFDRADAGEHDRSASLGPKRVIVHLVPQLFDAEGIAAE